MTIAKLHRLLAELIEQGHGRKRVCINKRAFTSPLEGDGGVIMEVHNALLRTHRVLNDDGFTRERKDGAECTTTALVLYGTEGVPIAVNGEECFVVGGYMTAGQVSYLVNAPATDVVELLVDGKLTEWRGGTVRGGEQFITNPGDGVDG